MDPRDGSAEAETSRRSTNVPRVALLLLAWLVVAAPASLLIFVHSSRSVALASHQATIHPSFDGYATLDFGPFIPTFRYPSGGRVGAYVDLGKTDLQSYQALIDRYAFIASQPKGQIAKLESTLTKLAIDSAVRGALIGAVLPGVWLLLGPRRREELFQRVGFRRASISCAAVALGVIAATHPWDRVPTEFQQRAAWESITDALPGVPIPAVARPLQIETGLLTSGTQRLVTSAFSSYRESLTYYKDIARHARGIGGQLHQPGQGEVVAVLVADRHDNIGMDPVARAIADAGGATFLLDAGDDTSTGSPWEAFSLESLDQAFKDYDQRFAIAGNHDNGRFVPAYGAKLGFTELNADVVDGPQGIRILGVNDPRSSGLGAWKDEVGISFEEQTHRLADIACQHDADGDRISTLLVHDANNGQEALDRGCVDLVAAGHVHVRLGPTKEVGANGKVGYTYTTGTTGGAAYALAIGTSLRRDAMVSLITYRDGRPVGVQPVTIRTIGDFRVGPYIHLAPTGPDRAKSGQ